MAYRRYLFHLDVYNHRFLAADHALNILRMNQNVRIVTIAITIIFTCRDFEDTIDEFDEETSMVFFCQQLTWPLHQKA